MRKRTDKSTHVKLHCFIKIFLLSIKELQVLPTIYVRFILILSISPKCTPIRSRLKYAKLASLLTGII